MNADTQQWLLCNTSPDVRSMMPPTIMGTLNPRLVYPGLLDQPLHGTVVVAGNILLDLVKHVFSCFSSHSFPTPLLSSLEPSRTYSVSMRSSPSALFIMWQSLSSLLSLFWKRLSAWPERLVPLLHGGAGGVLSTVSSVSVHYRYSHVYKTNYLIKVLNWVKKVLHCFYSVWRLREGNSYTLKLFLTLSGVPWTGIILILKLTWEFREAFQS